jgi:hypothetical protein
VDVELWIRRQKNLVWDLGRVRNLLGAQCLISVWLVTKPLLTTDDERHRTAAQQSTARPHRTAARYTCRLSTESRPVHDREPAAFQALPPSFHRGCSGTLRLVLGHLTRPRTDYVYYVRRSHLGFFEIPKRDLQSVDSF